MSHPQELEPGTKYGDLEVIRLFRRDRKRTLWLCRCACGNESARELGMLVGGKAVRCKECNIALRTKHGHLSKGKISRTYKTWVNMLGRCNRPNADNYKYYGGRGIKVCNRWLKFENFLEDMGEKPDGQYEIDRLDTNGNYEPCNCEWKTKKDNARNTRKNVFFSIDGVTQCLSAWAEESGVKEATIRYRMRQGKSIKEALSTPVSQEKKMISWEGRTLSLSDWSRETGIPKATILDRLRRGWSVDKALTTSPVLHPASRESKSARAKIKQANQ